MIKLDNVSLELHRFRDSNPSLKDFLSNIWVRKPKGFDTFKILDEISFNIACGERVGIVGGNGAGKSTLLKLIAGIYYPSAGDLKVDGEIVPLIEIGAGFHPEFTARENIYLCGSIIGQSYGALSSIEKDILDFAGVSDFADTPVKYFSTGMYMRLAFSLATSVNPDILVLDEIFAGGDVGFYEKAKRRLVNLVEQSRIMLMVSHDENIVKSLCNRVIFINNGKVVADGDPGSVFKEYNNWQNSIS